MVLSTEWSQVESIVLQNDGSGLGFGIVGGRSTGVVIKSILPGGIADKDGRLQSGDHIMQIGDVCLRGLASDQVATVLRQAGAQVRILVARPVDPTITCYRSTPAAPTLIPCSTSSIVAPIVPTKILTDSDELDRLFITHQNGYEPESLITPSTTLFTTNTIAAIDKDKEVEDQEVAKKEEENDKRNHLVEEITNNRNCILSSVSSSEKLLQNCTNNNKNNKNNDNLDSDNHNNLDKETERFDVVLTKNKFGLGITVAGYVCEREELSGIFVKDISAGSAAYNCTQIHVNDRIVNVDGHDLQGYTNHEAVNLLKSSSDTVTLTLERYLSGPKYEKLQEALGVQKENESRGDLSPPSPPSATTLSWIPIEFSEAPIEAEDESVFSIHSDIYEENVEENREIFIEADFKYTSSPSYDLDAATRQKWRTIIGEQDTEIIVANLTKLKGLGISLEGTVDVLEGGVELHSHHYIRSILPEGPVGVNGKLNSGDELLEVNGQRLLGVRHVDVVKILRELPGVVRLVCARKRPENRVINTSQDRDAFEARNILGGSLKNLLADSIVTPKQSLNHQSLQSPQGLPQSSQIPESRPNNLLKSSSETNLNTSSTVTITDEENNSIASKQPSPITTTPSSPTTPLPPISPPKITTKARSLEIVTGLAMWCDSYTEIDLVKTDRGLGFSILDYQDPVDTRATVIVVRSLVPNGAAEQDGRLTPGDRLISVNGVELSRVVRLDEAVKVLKGTLPGVVRLLVAKPMPRPGKDG